MAEAATQMSIFDAGASWEAGYEDPGDIFGTPPRPPQTVVRHEDFGEKIGGSRKDLWRLRGLMLGDLDDMNDAERARWVTKDAVWPAPKWRELVAEGLPREVAYFRKLVRDSLPTRPVAYGLEVPASAEGQRRFVRLVSKVRDAACAPTTVEDLRACRTLALDLGLVERIGVMGRLVATPEALGYEKSLNRLLKALRKASSPGSLAAEAIRKGFAMTEDEKSLARWRFVRLAGEPAREGSWLLLQDLEAASRLYVRPPADDATMARLAKGSWAAIDDNHQVAAAGLGSRDEAFAAALGLVAQGKRGKSRKARKADYVPPRLARLTREGPDRRGGRHVTGDDLIERFGFHGGEYGNWVTEDERRASLDMAYDAFCDLAEALGIEDTDMSLGGRLSIAFGARGRGGAMMAHFEPERCVINLTRLRGAGSLAHEWMHALDYVAGQELGLAGPMTSATNRDREVPPEALGALTSLKWRTLEGQEAKAKRAQSLEATLAALRGDLDAVSARPDDDAWAEERGRAADRCIAAARDGDEDAWSAAFEDFCAVQAAHGDLNPSSKRNRRYFASKGALAASEARVAGLPAEDQTPCRVATRFLEDARELDKGYSRRGHLGYWQSDVELWARAGAAWASDRLEAAGLRNDYLCGHADDGLSDNGEGRTPSIAPQGADRVSIDSALDSALDALVERGVLHRRGQDLGDFSHGIEKGREHVPVRI